MRETYIGALAATTLIVINGASLADPTSNRQLPPNVGTGYTGTVGSAGTAAARPGTGQTTGAGKGAKSSGGNTPYTETRDPRVYGGSNYSKYQQYLRDNQPTYDDRKDNCTNCAR